MSAVTLAPDGRPISYAQNGEDIVLLRAFEGQELETCVDVGADHPVNDSVTKIFSDLGWSGISVEPVGSFFEKLERDRPDDVNLIPALSDSDGTLVFHRNDSNLDLSTFDDELFQRYRDRGDTIVDDGLNAWFVRSSEREELGPKLALPPSPILDWYHPAIYMRMMQERDDRIADLLRQVEQPSPNQPSLVPRLRSGLGRVRRGLQNLVTGDGTIRRIEPG